MLNSFGKFQTKKQSKFGGKSANLTRWFEVVFMSTGNGNRPDKSINIYKLILPLEDLIEKGNVFTTFLENSSGYVTETVTRRISPTWRDKTLIRWVYFTYPSGGKANKNV